MPEYDNTDRGALFKNDDKVKDTDRDYSGRLNVGGREFWVSGWVKVSKKTGKKYLSISVKPKDSEADEAAASMNDSIEF